MGGAGLQEGLRCGPAPSRSPFTKVTGVSRVCRETFRKGFPTLRDGLLTERPSDGSLKGTRRWQEAGQLQGLRLPLRGFGVWAQSHKPEHHNL